MKLYSYTKFNESIEDIHALCKKYDIRNYKINSDGSIDVKGNINLNRRGLSKLPLKFNRISGDFSCGGNKLTTLEGCPKFVGGDFYCEYNQFTTLENCPEYVGGYFACRVNQLKDFRGFPEFYDGRVYFYENPVNEVIKNIPSDKKCKFIHLLNEYSVIRPSRKIIRDRLDAAYDGVGLAMPENIEIDGYEII